MSTGGEHARRWYAALAALAAVRLAFPLTALAAEGHKLPGIPRYDYEGLRGDAEGFYAAAREFMASWARVHPGLLAALAAAAVAGVAIVARLWRDRPVWRPWLLAATALGFGLLVVVGIEHMEPAGAAVFGWPLVWSLPMLPYRALGLPLDPDIGFVFGLPLSLASLVMATVATAYAGLYATRSRAVGLLAAGLFALWPLLSGLVGGRSAWENATWHVDAGLHLYTEPLSTALVAVAVALVLRPEADALRLAVAGVAVSLATVVKLSNALTAALLLVLLAYRAGPRQTAPYLAGAISLAPVAIAYWPLGYEQLFDNPVSWPRNPFSLEHAGKNWTDSLLYTPDVLAILLPLAVVGAIVLRHRFAGAVLIAVLLVNPVFYTFYALTNLHPRFLHASLPALFVLQAVGAIALWRTVRPPALGSAQPQGNPSWPRPP